MMHIKIKISVLFSLLLTTHIVNAQYSGEWVTHFSYNKVDYLTQSANKVYAVSNGNMFSVEKGSSSGLDLFSKVTGLSDNVITKVEFDSKSEQLIVVYNNSNIDIIANSGIVNIADIKNKNIIGGKAVNDIYFIDRQAYLSCEFGIVSLNMRKREIQETYIIGDNASQVSVLGTVVVGEFIYSITADAVYKADTKENLLDYNNWHIILQEDGAEADFSPNKKMAAFANGIFILKEDGGIYTLDEEHVLLEKLPNKAFVAGLRVNNNVMTAHSDNKIYKYNTRLECDSSNTLTQVMKDVIYAASENVFWAGTEYSGLKKIIVRTNTNAVETFLPSGPSNSSPAVLFNGGNKLYVTQGGPPFINNLYVSSDLMMYDYESRRWSVVGNWDIMPYTGNRPLSNANSLLIPKNSNSVYVSSYRYGLFVFKDDKFEKLYNHTNSNLEPFFQVTNPDIYADHIRIDGLQSDSLNNIWMLNAGTTNAVKILKTDNTWTSRYYPELVNATYLNKFTFTAGNLKWLILNNKSIFVFDDNRTEDTADDKKITYSDFRDQDNKTIGINSFFDIVEDKTGNIWIGTDKGPVIITNPKDIFSPTFRCSRIKRIQEDAEPNEDGSLPADILLGYETINCIAIDGANRKWLGTATSGVYLVSDNGQETIYHFTTENSPLPSNQILSLAIYGGDVFIGTTNGLLAYKSDAIEGASNYKNLHVFPNPVRPEYEGYVTITGLMESSIVKITDVNGLLVYEATSNGGMLVWDGKNVNGHRVATGVYLIFAVSKDGKSKAHSKVLFIN